MARDFRLVRSLRAPHERGGTKTYKQPRILWDGRMSSLKLHKKPWVTDFVTIFDRRFFCLPAWGGLNILTAKEK